LSKRISFIVVIEFRFYIIPVRRWTSSCHISLRRSSLSNPKTTCLFRLNTLRTIVVLSKLLKFKPCFIFLLFKSLRCSKRVCLF
jgi:hypothetical protein